MVQYAEHLVKEKYLNAEVNSFTKKGDSWTRFKLTDKTKKAVADHLGSKMASYKFEDFKKKVIMK